ncbi:MAG TPA: diguanylate cyclase [Steroidobacteraceae bacterium]|nr:diguanylate cyclase [Steroidobacteraceae bacterium]
MATAAQDEERLRKYQESLRILERDEKLLRAREQELRRLVGRLCLAAQGQSPGLDSALGRLRNAVRGEVEVSQLESLGSDVASAVRQLDMGTATLAGLQTGNRPAIAPRGPDATGSTPALPGQALVGAERLRSIITRLLGELRSEPKLASGVAAIDRELAISLTQEQLPQVIERVGGLVVQRIQGLERAREELQQMLDQMVAQLEMLSRYVAGHDLEASERQTSNETLNTQITGEMHAMGSAVDTGSDLATLRRQLRLRMDSIGRHLQDFREREQEHARQARERTDQMRGRMEELEREARKLHASLADEKRMSLLDPLTRIPNRLAYEQRMEDELERFRRFGQPVCLATCDIDHFKRINDSYGHRAGDKVLQVVSECFAASVRSTDFVARYGGEEFVFVLPGSTLEDAQGLMNRIREKVGEVGFHFRGTPVSVTVSCGITALRPDDGADDAFDRADKAMYQAKDAGRNRVVAV